MYILVKEGIPLGHQVNGVAHASLACYLQHEDDEEVEAWLGWSFKKVTCLVSEEEFERAKGFEDGLIMTESALDGAETVIAFKPRYEWPEIFKTFRLFK